MSSEEPQYRPCSNKGCLRSLCIDAGGDDFFAFLPCKCILCPKCAFELFVNRKFHNPSCHNLNCRHPGAGPVKKMAYMESWRQIGQVEVIEIKQHEANRDKDPCRYFEQRFRSGTAEDDVTKKLLLSLSYAHKQTNKSFIPASITVEMDRDYGPESGEDEANLRRLFGFLHEPIIGAHGKIVKKTRFPRMTAAEFCKYILYEDNSLLLKLIYALGTGEMTVPMKKIETNSEFFSRFLQCGVAKEMLQRLGLNRPGPFQMMMGDMFHLAGASQDTTNFMSKIRVSAHRTTMERECTKKALEYINKKIRLQPLDAFSLHFDNIGFKGRKAKWSQHTIIQICTIRYEDLKKAGFYNNGRLSRQRKEFQQLLDDIEAETGESEEIKLARHAAKKVVGLRKSDWKKLTTRVLTSIKTAINLELPNELECHQMAAVGETFSNIMVPLNLGNKIVDHPPRQGTSSGVYNVAINGAIPDSTLNKGNDEPSFRKTFYEANDMTLDNVLHEDPNARKTVEKLADYLEEASSECDVFDVTKSCGEMPVIGMIAPATCDGAPMKRWLDLRAKDLQENGFENRTYKRAVMFSGGFHYLMEFMTMRGRLSRGIFSFFGALWRPSTPQLNYILSISDPTDYLVEMPQYLLAHYGSAYDMLCGATRLCETDPPPSPADVHKHMLDPAKAIPTCMAVLLDLRLIEISFMIRDSEKAGDFGDLELFLTTMRFALALFTVTHAINYAHIVCDFLEWWELSSDADKVFFRRWLYTKVSPFGKPIWVDRGVEWTIRHIRMFLGRKARCNQEVLMERTVPDIPFRIQAKNDLAHLLGVDNYDSYTTGNWNETQIRLSTVYFETVKAIYSTNLWGQGNLTGAFACDNPSFFLHAEEGEEELPMSNSFLSAFEFGEERALCYFIEHHVINRGSVSRSEQNVSLKLLPTAATARQLDLKKLRAIRISTKPNELLPLQREFPKSKIVEELQQLRDCVYPEIPPHQENTSSRADLVNDLCKYRSKYFADFPEVYESTIESIEALQLEDTFTSPEQREKQIEHSIYSLDQDVVEHFH